MSRRAILFVVIVACCLGGAAAYLVHAVRRTAPAVTVSQQSAGSGALRPLAPGETPPAGPLVVFRHTSRGPVQW